MRRQKETLDLRRKIKELGRLGEVRETPAKTDLKLRSDAIGLLTLAPKL